MKLKDQVVSLELAKKLKELGVAQNNLFVWQRFESQGLWSEWQLGTVHEDVFPDEYVPAFTVAELGEILKSSDYYLPYSHADWSVWECRVGNGLDGEKQYLQAPTEANARAKMLIYLLENNLITV